ncbi:hypothetical protein ACM26V_09235 [Salipaludibacillus sp. HK11]
MEKPQTIVTHESKVEGVGTVKVYGTIDAEKLFKRLLKSKHIV